MIQLGVSQSQREGRQTHRSFAEEEIGAEDEYLFQHSR